MLRNSRIKQIAWFVGVLAIAAWCVSNIFLILQNGDLVDLVQDVEAQNEELDDRLQCRAVANDNIQAAVARGLVAVARNDDQELQYQATIILEQVNELEACE